VTKYARDGKLGKAAGLLKKVFEPKLLKSKDTEEMLITICF
jgi:hypothetical protein